MFSLYGYPIDPVSIENIISSLHSSGIFVINHVSIYICVSVHVHLFYSSQQLLFFTNNWTLTTLNTLQGSALSTPAFWSCSTETGPETGWKLVNSCLQYEFCRFCSVANLQLSLCCVTLINFVKPVSLCVK